MRLSGELFDHLVAALRSPGCLEHPDFRQAERVQIMAPAPMLTRSRGAGSAPVTVLVKEISASGIGLVHTEAIAVGDWCVVQLPRRGGRDPVGILCTVVHWQKVTDGLYVGGAEFTAVLSEVAPPQEPERATQPAMVRAPTAK